MEKKRKKIKIRSIIIVLVIILLIILGILIIRNITNNDSREVSAQSENTVIGYVEEIEDGIKVNTSKAMNTSKTLDGLLISNIQLSNRSGMTSFLADVTNNTDKSTSVKTVEITLLSYNGEEMAKLTGIINALNPGETTELNIATTSDYVTAYDFTITEK